MALAPVLRFCNIRTVAKNAQEQGGNESASFDAVWKDVRADEDIQFVAAKPEPPEEPPQWWTDFLEWLQDVLGPVAEVVVEFWPVLRILLLVLLAAGILTLLWIIVAPYVEEWRNRPATDRSEEWRPEQGAARKLLEEAEALAAQGRFKDAVHLLLFRSIEDIERRRPDILRPSSTSREIGRFESLPENARNMFAVIAREVEQGIFAGAPIGEKGWTVSREAYGAFALAETWRGGKSDQRKGRKR